MYIHPKFLSSVFVYPVEVESSVFLFIKCSDKKVCESSKVHSESMHNPLNLLVHIPSTFGGGCQGWETSCVFHNILLHV